MVWPTLGSRTAKVQNSICGSVVMPWSDPTQTALGDAVIRGWQTFVNIVSVQHGVYLQVHMYTRRRRRVRYPPRCRMLSRRAVSRQRSRFARSPRLSRPLRSQP